MNDKFEMVAKTFKGLEGVLADELRTLGADDVTEGNRMVSFTGDKKMMYRANFCLRTALRVLKPIYKFRSTSADDLYEQIKLFDWDSVLDPTKTFAIDATTFGEEFSHSRFVTYRVKDAIVDYFTDKCGKRPSIRVTNPDIRLDVHISGNEVTLSLDSSGDPLYKRGWREAQTDAPINEVLAAGIIKLSGWDGECNFVDPMCGSGTFLVEAALIAANINPGVYRESFAFQSWTDYDQEMFEEIYNDDSAEREFKYKIYGSDVNGKAIAISRANIKRAGVAKMVELEMKDFNDITEVPEHGVLITNPPYGERLKVEDIEGLYTTIGNKLKQVFKGYSAWIIGYDRELTDKIGLKPSVRYALFNGALDCELRQYVIFDGKYNDMRGRGESIKNEGFRASDEKRAMHRREFRETFGDGERRERRESRGHDSDRRERRDFGGEKRDRMERGGERREFRGHGGERRDFGEKRERRDFGDNRERRDNKPRINFGGPRLTAENDVPIVHGRRKSWKRRDLNEGDIAFNPNKATDNPAGENKED